MPCNTQRQITQLLENIKDLDLLKDALEQMGFAVRLTGTKLAFSGVDNTTGGYNSGSYANGKLKLDTKLDLDKVNLGMGIASMKKQVAKKNEKLSGKFKWRIKKLSDTSFQIIKPQ